MKPEHYVIALLVMVLGIGYWGLGKLRVQNAEYEQLAESRAWEVVRWRNAHGNAQARIKTLQSSRDALEVFYQDWVDSLSEQMNIKNKRIEAITSVGLFNERFIRVPVRDTLVLKDSVYVRANGFAFADRWSSVQGLFTDSGVELTQRYQDSLSVVSHLKRDKGVRGWVLGKRTLYTDVVSHNPYSSITGVKSWQKAVPVKRFGLGPYVGYDPLRGLSFGVSLQYAVFRF